MGRVTPAAGHPLSFPSSRLPLLPVRQAPISSLKGAKDRALAKPLSLMRLVGVTPSQVTAAGLVLGVAAGLALAAGSRCLGFTLALTSAACDLLDGGLARATGSVTPFGTYLDAACDRGVEAFLLGGLITSGAAQPPALLLWLGSVALLAARHVARTRGTTSDGAPFSRGERFTAVLLAILIPWPSVSTAILAGAGLASFASAASVVRASGICGA